MKRLLRIFELSAIEQRVVLIVMVILVTIAFIAYERRVRHSTLQPTAATQAGRSPTPALSEDRQ